jgi:thioester reductase-like protein
MNILITGGTGFLGKYLVRDLAALFDNVYVLSRQASQGSGSNIFSDLKNVSFIAGDITSFDILTIEDNRKDEFLDSIDVILHAAALYDLAASYSDCFLQNVAGTQGMVRFANKLKNLKSFYYISTIAVGDPNSYFLNENELPKRRTFDDAYSESKYLAEKIIRENIKAKYSTRIFRPGIIIGDSETREMSKIDGPYYFLEAFKKHSHLLKHLPLIPLSFNPRSKIPLIPVDHCSRFIKLLIERDARTTELKTYHLIGSDLPNLNEFLNDLNKKFEVKTHYIPVKKNAIHDSLLKLLGIPKEVFPFMFSKLSYDKTSTLEDLPELEECSYNSFKKILFG